MERKKRQMEEQLVVTGAAENNDKLNVSFRSNQSDESSQNQKGVIRRATTKQLRLQKEQDLHQKAIDVKFLEEIVNKDKKLGLGNDTYAMAFKAFNWEVMRDLDLDMDDVHNAYHAAMFVFGF